MSDLDGAVESLKALDPETETYFGWTWKLGFPGYDRGQERRLRQYCKDHGVTLRRQHLGGLFSSVVHFRAEGPAAKLVPVAEWVRNILGHGRELPFGDPVPGDPLSDASLRNLAGAATEMRNGVDILGKPYQPLLDHAQLLAPFLALPAHDPRRQRALVIRGHCYESAAGAVAAAARGARRRPDVRATVDALRGQAVNDFLEASAGPIPELRTEARTAAVWPLARLGRVVQARAVFGSVTASGDPLPKGEAVLLRGLDLVLARFETAATERGNDARGVA